VTRIRRSADTNPGLDRSLSGRYLQSVMVGNSGDTGIAVSQDASTDMCFLDQNSRNYEIMAVIGFN